MSMTQIEVLADPTVKTGGHAVIRLRGVAILPPGATLRIEPIDESLAADDGWPNGEIKPLAMRQTPDGVELNVGPSVVDAPLLGPGVPVLITIAEAGLSAELVWPDLPASRGPAAAPRIMSASQMAAEFASVERAKADAQRQAAEAVAKRERDRKESEAARHRDTAVAAAIAAAVSPPASTGATALAGDKAGSPVAVRDAMVRDAKVLPMRPASMTDAVRDLNAMLADHKTTGTSSLSPASAATLAKSATLNRPNIATAGTTTGAADVLSTLSTPPPGTQPAISQASPADLERLSRLSARQSPAVDNPSGAIASAEGSLPAIVVKAANEAAAKNALLLPVEDGHGRVNGRGTISAFFAGAALAAASLLLAVFAAPLIGLGLRPPEAPARTVIADSFMAGPQSPRGEMAASTDLPTALRLADYNLHGVDRPIDRAEGEFWLKKAMSLTASHPQLRWAITQLGTLAAQPISGLPDYDKARLLWEISAGNGDPIALCFLGSLAENGLGGPPDRSRALEYYNRAKEIGGCPTSDEAIARLSK